MSDAAHTQDDQLTVQIKAVLAKNGILNPSDQLIEDMAELIPDEEPQQITADDVALASIQGMLAGRVPPDAVAMNTWMTVVPAYFRARNDFMTKFAPGFAKIAEDVARRAAEQQQPQGQPNAAEPGVKT